MQWQAFIVAYCFIYVVLRKPYCWGWGEGAKFSAI